MNNIKALEEQDNTCERPSREEAEAAVRVLLKWAGDDPDREGLLDTPKRVVKAYEEFFAGYSQSAEDVLGKTFDDILGYDDFVLVKNIDFTSHCEHHIVPIQGIAHVAYIPDNKVVGISKLARIVDIFSKRLISQENLTREVADSITNVLKPKGVAVVIDAVHNCMSTRGVNKPNSSTVTSMFTGEFKDNQSMRDRFLNSF